MRRLFQEFPSIGEFYRQDQFMMWLNIVGLGLIVVTFMSIGLLCVTMADAPTIPPKTKKSILLTRLFGWFLIACSLGRCIDIVAFWHSYPIFNGWVRIITGVIAGISITLIPGIIAETKQSLSLKEAGHKLDETKEKLEKVEEISRKLDEDGNTTGN